MALNSKQRQYLKGLAHSLPPVAIIGQKGATDNVFSEIERNLAHHELIKVKVRCDDQSELREFVDAIAEKCDADLVQVIGHIVVLYKQNPEKPEIKLPL